MLAGMRDMEPTIEISDTDLIGSFYRRGKGGVQIPIGSSLQGFGLHRSIPSTLLCDVCGVSHSEGCDLCGGQGIPQLPM